MNPKLTPTLPSPIEDMKVDGNPASLYMWSLGVIVDMFYITEKSPYYFKVSIIGVALLNTFDVEIHHKIYVYLHERFTPLYLMTPCESKEFFREEDG